MAVAHDAVSNSGAFTTTPDPFTWTHTPVGTPRGVLVFTISRNATNVFSAVTYGGVSMTAVTGGEAIDTAGEPGTTTAWFLGSGIPTGAQTVSVDHDASNTTKHCYCVTVTASADTNTVGTPVLLQNDGTLAEQNVDSSGNTALRYAGAWSGRDKATAIVPGANSTALSDIWQTNLRGSAVVRETTAGSGSRPVGFSDATSDDRAVVHLAIAETAAGNVTVTPSTASLTLTTFAPTVTATGGVTVTPTTATLNLTTFAPTVTAAGAFAQGASGFQIIG